MNLNGQPVRVGDLVHTAPREVSPEIARFYRETLREAPAGDDAPAPPLLYHSEVYSHIDRWYLKNLVGNLHARQEWACFSPIRVGEPLLTRSTIVERYRKRGRDFIVNEVDYCGPDGRLCVRGRTHQSFLAEEVAADADVVDRDTARKKARKPVGAGEGPELESFTFEVDLRTCWRFSGPHKNYHTDREAARKWGFPDVVVQGMLSTCLIARLMSEHFGAGWTTGGRMDVKLTNVLWGGESVRTRGKLIDESPEGDALRRTYEVWVEKTDADATVVTVGTASGLAR